MSDHSKEPPLLIYYDSHSGHFVAQRHWLVLRNDATELSELQLRGGFVLHVKGSLLLTIVGAEVTASGNLRRSGC